MCGIAGIVAPQAAQYKQDIEQMLGKLAHRGPDGSGTHFFTTCGLGHTRLSIIDLETGAQPLLDRENSKAVTFNGEIYGYRKIRNQLAYPFTTSSDTEVILALYDQYGERMMPHLPGMFAFALWDDTKQQLFCARDRFGEKPFYYAFGKKGEFIFASEIKAIVATGLVKPKLDHNSLLHYLRYLYVHPSKTIYSNIHCLPPGHSLVFSGNLLEVEQYWQPSQINDSIALEDASDEFRRLFERAVEQQMVSDVPIGFFLSGGLDSSSVVAAATQYSGNVKTFSFDFEGDSSETPYAREIANKYGTDHTELSARCSDISGLLLEMLSVYDEPFADSSNIPTYLISKLAREHAKVVLTGDGGDELLAGYSFWYKPLLDYSSRTSPKIITPFFRYILAQLISLDIGTIGRKCERYLRSGLSLVGHHDYQQRIFSDRELARLGLPAYDDQQPLLAGNTMDDVLRRDVEHYMPGDILVKIDRAAMSHGLELRAPFLDKDLAEFCLSLPSRLKINGNEDKIVLRRAYADKWTDSIRKRDKQGFGAPVNQWLKKDSMRQLKADYLEDQSKQIFSIIRYDHAKPFIMADDYKTWSLLVLSLWLENHDC